jgi:HPt (histidine-containing phosphotransfer) domain-containing protein
MITLFSGSALDMNSEGLQSILQLAEGEASVLMEIISDVLDYTPGLLQDLALAIEQEQAPKVKLSAHSLKSSSAQIGALRLADLCEQLEKKSAQGDLNQAIESLQQIYQEYEQVQKEINEWKTSLLNQ